MPGVTRSFVINSVIKDSDYEIRVENFSEEELLDADEIFITNSTQGILPITHINKKEINNAECGDITSKLYKIFTEKIN